MPKDSIADSVALCDSDPRNCELLNSLNQLHAQRSRESGLSDPKAIVDAMAVGLVLEV